MDKILIKIINDETFLTILSGVIVFIISQIIFEFIIKPREEFNKLKGEIICCLTVKEKGFRPCASAHKFLRIKR